MPRRKKVDCTFCGDKGVPRSSEDVIPKWIGKKLAFTAERLHPGIKPAYVHHRYDNSEAFRADIQNRFPGERAKKNRKTGEVPVPYKLPDVCVACNGGWMGRLEEAAKQLFPGFMVGDQKQLAPFDQFIIGTWVVKTCLTYDAALELRLIPEHLGSREFFRLGYPLLGAQVLIGHDPDHTPQGEGMDQRKPRTQSEHLGGLDVRAVGFTFQFDCLLFFCIINYGEDYAAHPEHGITVKPPNYFTQVWPPQGRFLWPSEIASIPRHAPTPTSGAEEPVPDEPAQVPPPPQ